MESPTDSELQELLASSLPATRQTEIETLLSSDENLRKRLALLVGDDRFDEQFAVRREPYQVT